MKYNLRTPCAECPFRISMEHGFSDARLAEFGSGMFPCHKTAVKRDGQFLTTNSSSHCAGALIYLEKRNKRNQMTRIAERLGEYDRSLLDMEAPVR